MVDLKRLLENVGKFGFCLNNTSFDYFYTNFQEVFENSLCASRKKQL